MKDKFRDRAGQSLPLVMVFMGLILAMAAVTIDVGKVLSLRNQAQSASSAAALAAAENINAQINTQLNPVTTASGYVTVTLTNPTSLAQAIYANNIKTAIPHSSSLNTCQVTYFLGSLKNPVTGDPASVSLTVNSPIYVQVRSSGTTTMTFGSAIGVGIANVAPLATAESGAQANVSTLKMLPLLLPLTNPLSNTNQAWRNYWADNQDYAVYRGSGSGKTPSWTGSYPPANVIAYHKSPGDGTCGGSGIFGSGGFGWFDKENESTLGVDQVIQGQPGTEDWKSGLQSLQTGQEVILPVAYPYGGSGCKDTSKEVTVYGFVTATILSVHDQGGETGIGFSFHVDHRYAVNSTASPNNPSSSLAISYSAQLVPNSGS